MLDVLAPDLVLHSDLTCLTNLDLAGRSCRLEHAHTVHELPEKVVPLHLSTDDAADDYSVVHADRATDPLALLPRPLVRCPYHVQGEVHANQRRIRLRERGRRLPCDVGVTHGLDF